ncbi:MAG: deoxyribonuclease IV [Dialister sp.]|nr:deoxyribonuclease IV [Dialister sp.]
MFTIGCHLSVSKGYLHMAKEATSIGANTFQFFPRNPRGGASKPLVPEDVEALSAWMKEHRFGKILCHGAYTMNGASLKEEVRNFARQAIREDLVKVSQLPDCLYNFHPGTHLKQGAEKAIPLIADMVNFAMDYEDLNTTVLLETMAGKGTEVGRSFEELADIIERVERKDRIGVCLDTCHIYDGGYDIVNDLDGVLESFDKVIGLERLKAIHLNDDKNPMGSQKDRHEKIGKGTIGLEAFERIINHPSLRDLPFYLETPNDLAGYKEEIEILKALRKE